MQQSVGEISVSAKRIYERGCQEKQLPDGRRSGQRCRGSQPLYRYRKPLFRQSAVKSCILIRRSFRKLNSIRGGMCRPWIYLRLEGYRCFRSCEGG